MLQQQARILRACIQRNRRAQLVNHPHSSKKRGDLGIFGSWVLEKRGDSVGGVADRECEAISQGEKKQRIRIWERLEKSRQEEKESGRRLETASRQSPANRQSRHGGQSPETSLAVDSSRPKVLALAMATGESTCG